MRNHILALFLSALCVSAWAARAEKRSAAAKKTSASQSSAPKKASKKGRISRHSTSRNKHAAQSWRAGQRTPTPERYTEIQQALIDKGYLEGPATGVWDQSSIAALRRFQQEQNLEPTGTLDSLSLIALGLGPKHEAQAAPQTSENKP